MNLNELKRINEEHRNVILKQLITTFIALLLCIVIHTNIAGDLHFFVVIFYLMVVLIPLLIPCLFLIKGLFTGEKESFEVAKATGITSIPAIIMFVFF